MSPEQLHSEEVDRRTDLFAAAIVLWETLVGRRLFATGDVGSSVTRILTIAPDPPSKHAPDIPPALDALVLKGLSKARGQRFTTAKAMAQTLEAAVPPAGALEVGAWVERLASEELHRRIEGSLPRGSEPPHESVTVQTTIDLSSPPAALANLRSGAITDVTEISLAAGTPAIPRPRSRRGLAIMGSVALLTLAIGGLAIMRLRHNPSISPPAETSRSAAIVSAVNAPVASALSAPVASEPAASASNVAPAPSALPQKVRASAAAPIRRSPATGAARTKKAGCNPPYVMKADGTKRFKPECF
jgi:serine/threonine-protein kinase